MNYSSVKYLLIQRNKEKKEKEKEENAMNPVVC